MSVSVSTAYRLRSARIHPVAVLNPPNFWLWTDTFYIYIRRDDYSLTGRTPGNGRVVELYETDAVPAVVVHHFAYEFCLETTPIVVHTHGGTRPSVVFSEEVYDFGSGVGARCKLDPGFFC